MGTKVVAVVLASFTLLGACRSKEGAPNAAEQTGSSIREVTVTEVATFFREKSATIVDANGTDTRKEYGVVPGAVLLTSSKDFSVDVLPPVKSSKLVFYCGGTMCRASDSAASRARSAGYTDVNVMREGIKGWKNAGQPTDMPRS
jgi:rhodanese-related sulfurtransferase